MSAAVGREPFWLYLGLAGGVAGVGLVIAALGPSPGEARLGALVGTGAAALSGAVALPLKRRALAKSLQAALLAMGAVFGLRMLLVAAGLAVAASGRGQTSFTLGFLGLYLALQWLEISYLVAERKRSGPGV